MVLAHPPHHAPAVHPPDALTSDSGWDTIKHRDYLRDIIQALQEKSVRVSIFVDPMCA